MQGLGWCLRQRRGWPPQQSGGLPLSGPNPLRGALPPAANGQPTSRCLLSGMAVATGRLLLVPSPVTPTALTRFPPPPPAPCRWSLPRRRVGHLGPTLSPSPCGAVASPHLVPVRGGFEAALDCVGLQAAGPSGRLPTFGLCRSRGGEGGQPLTTRLGGRPTTGGGGGEPRALPLRRLCPKRCPSPAHRAGGHDRLQRDNCMTPLDGGASEEGERLSSRRVPTAQRRRRRRPAAAPPRPARAPPCASATGVRAARAHHLPAQRRHHHRRPVARGVGGAAAGRGCHDATTSGTGGT